VQLAELKGILRHVPNLEVIESKRQKMIEFENKLFRLCKVEEILRGSKDELKKLRENIEKNYLHSISQKTAEFFNKITDGRYIITDYTDNTIYLTKEDFVSSWRAVDEKNREYNFFELSDGARTQLLLSIRLALISSFLGTNTAFLLLDEPFAYFDRQREQKAREVLASLCKFGWQIILVSAKN